MVPGGFSIRIRKRASVWDKRLARLSSFRARLRPSRGTTFRAFIFAERRPCGKSLRDYYLPSFHEGSILARNACLPMRAASSSSRCA
jgi:hypothetical protein